jgi:hypothetical protein
VQPGRKRAADPERFRLSRQDQERGLNRVLRVVSVAQYIMANRQHRPSMPNDEHFKFSRKILGVSAKARQWNAGFAMAVPLLRSCFPPVSANGLIVRSWQPRGSAHSLDTGQAMIEHTGVMKLTLMQ